MVDFKKANVFADALNYGNEKYFVCLVDHTALKFAFNDSCQSAYKMLMHFSIYSFFFLKMCFATHDVQ